MQISLFDGQNKFKVDKPIRLIELFGGYGSQHFALEYLGVEFEQWKLCEWAVKSIQAYKDAHCGNDNTDYSALCSNEYIYEKLCKWGISANYNEPMTPEQIKRLGVQKQRQIYNNIIATHNLVNIQQVHAKDLDIQDTDKYCYIMTYSFPCQDLSLAGKQAGMGKGSGTRSGMLWEVERILDECEGEQKPQVLIMENVPEVIGTKNMPHFAKWLEKLESLGYHCYWQVLNGKDYGVPQNRERCFMVSILGDYYYEFPSPIPLEHRLKDLLEDDVAEKYYLSDRMIEYFEKHSKECEGKGSGFRFNPLKNTEVVAKAVTTRAGSRMDDNFIKLRELTRGQSQGNRVYDPNGLSVTINANGGGLGAKTGLYLVDKKPKNNKRVIVKYGSYYTWEDNKENINTQCNRAVNVDGYSLTIAASNTPQVLENYRIRKLTPKECFRLMGVKDNDFDKIAKNQSNASLYHLAGDSLITFVFCSIISTIIDKGEDKYLLALNDFYKKISKE